MLCDVWGGSSDAAQNEHTRVIYVTFGLGCAWLGPRWFGSLSKWPDGKGKKAMCESRAGPGLGQAAGFPLGGNCISAESPSGQLCQHPNSFHRSSCKLCASVAQSIGVFIILGSV